MCLFFQSSESHRHTDSPLLHQQTSASPLRDSYSPPGQSFYKHQPTTGLSNDHTPSSCHNQSFSQTLPTDSRPPIGSAHQQRGCSDVVSSQLKNSLLKSGDSAGASSQGSRAHGQTKVHLGTLASRGGQQQHQEQASPSQSWLQTSSRLLTGSGPANYPQQGMGLAQLQKSPLQGSGVRTQSGSL